MENQNTKSKQKKYEGILAAYREKFNTFDEPGRFMTQSDEDYYRMLLNAIQRGTPVTDDDWKGDIIYDTKKDKKKDK